MNVGMALMALVAVLLVRSTSALDGRACWSGRRGAARALRHVAGAAAAVPEPQDRRKDQVER
jgi:hypothetical protein